MKSLFSIGEVSKIKDISIKTLRHYHKINLLIPKYIDSKSGYRYYSIDQFIYIDIIKSCKTMGTSLSELKDLFQRKDINNLTDFLEKQKKIATKNIIHLEENIEKINVISNTIKKSLISISDENVTIKNLNERLLVIVPCNNISSLNILLEYSQVENLIKENKFINTFETGLLYKIDENNTLIPTHVFNTVKKDSKTKNSPIIYKIPAGKYACISYNSNTQHIQTKKLFTYLELNGIRKKAAIEIDLLNNIFDTKNYYCELQILV